jgi:hypothetical protein
MSENAALHAFRALRADVEQFDDHPMPDGGTLFSERVPAHMKSYLVNWLRRYVREHGDEVERALIATETST